jgi:hypothetical protein
MVTVADIASAVDLFLQTPKKVVGSEVRVPWANGFNEHEKVVHLPLEVEGEQTGAKLMVVGFPRARFLKFRLGILFPGAVCRLDYTDETHANSSSEIGNELPATVTGPHYHSWRVNRRFCRGGNLPAKLHNAEKFENVAQTFDAILRWFCADTKIESLPPNHRIELPTTDQLI